MQIYWYDDGGGTRVPATFEIQYKNGEGEWQTANMTTDFAAAQALNQYNIIEFDEIEATSIKLLMTLQEGIGGTGIYRWKVFSVNSNFDPGTDHSWMATGTLSPLSFKLLVINSFNLLVAILSNL